MISNYLKATPTSLYGVKERMRETKLNVNYETCSYKFASGVCHKVLNTKPSVDTMLNWRGYKTRFCNVMLFSWMRSLK